MSDTPLTPAVRDLLAAVVDVLDVPLSTYEGRDEHRMLLACRAASLHAYLDSLLRHGTVEDYHATGIRRISTGNPVTYEPYRPGETELTPETEACGRCKKPFDATDGRHDGHARYASTEWCRRCIDTCRDGGAGAEHVCVICDPARYGGGDRG